MTTWEFITMLQEEDPSGKLHVRFRGSGTPQFTATVPGYYDGPNSIVEAIKKDGSLTGKYCFTIDKENDKVEIFLAGEEDCIIDAGGNPKDIEIVFKGCKDEEKDFYMDQMKKACEKVKAEHEKSTQRFFYQVYKKLSEGWRIREDAVKDKYTVLRFVKDGKEKNLCGGEVNAVLETGLFEHVTEAQDTWVDLKAQ